MLDTEQQLARLRERIAGIERRFAETRRSTQSKPNPAAEEFEATTSRSRIEAWADGEVVANEHGEHYQTERLYPATKCHGSADIGALAELPHDLLDVLSENGVRACDASRWAFLDTETTGLAGGSGTYAFLIGVGRITPDGFRVRQFFLREYAEERSSLAALDEHLRQFDVLITYNGKSYDQPLLETRYRMARLKSPFGRFGHVDLLHGARRIWKLRLENCRLVQLEQEVLGVFREGDLPGELIPYVYFEYLRSGEARRLVPIFHHNAIDILTLACLTAIVPAAFRSADPDSLTKLGIRRGEDLAGIARWLNTAQEPEAALQLLRRSVDSGLPDHLLFRTLWDIARIEKKCGRSRAAVSVLLELTSCRNDYRVNALEALAKFYEHEDKNLALALEYTLQAIALTPSIALAQRRARLERRLAKPQARRLL